VEEDALWDLEICLKKMVFAHGKKEKKRPRQCIVLKHIY
jgi:hypothetical protein